MKNKKRSVKISHSSQYPLGAMRRRIFTARQHSKATQALY